MLFEIESTEPLDEIEKALNDSAARQKFGVIAVHDLTELLKNKGVALDMECRVYEVCNPMQAKKMLDANGAVSTALPCRISVYGNGARYTLATLLPTALMSVFEQASTGDVATEVEHAIVAIMKDAAA